MGAGPRGRGGREQPLELGDLRLLPLALAAWAGGWIGTWGSIVAVGIAAGTGITLAVAAAVRRSGLLAATGLVIIVTTLIGSVHAHRLSAGPVGQLVAAEAVVAAEVITSRDPHTHDAAGVRPEFLTVVATLVRVSGRGGEWRTRLPILITASGRESQRWRSAPVGTRWRVHGRLQPSKPRSGLAAVLRISGPAGGTKIAPPGPGLRAVERVRQGLRDAVGNRSEEPRALVPALVLGDTSAMTPELQADFATAGLTHLTAVSGANLTLLLAFVLTVARWTGVRGWSLRAVAVLGVVIFVGLCRSEPSVLRAAAMGLVALAALGSGGRRAGLRNLCLACLVLLIVDPFLSRSIGFALSVLACAGILGWARRWSEQLHRWMPRVVAESLAVPLAAQLATLPVVAAISGRVSVIGVLANAAAGPLVGPATVLGFVAAGLSVIHGGLASCAGFGAAWSAQLIIWVGSSAAQLPGASWHWPASPVGLGLLAALALTAGLALRQVLGRPWLALGLALAMIGAVLVVPSQPGWPPRAWVLVACDVGQGDGLVVRAAPRSALVIDTGPDPVAMRRCLDQLDISDIPVLILTHFHADHVDGLPGVAHRRIGQIWISPLASPADEAITVRRHAAQSGIPVRVPAVGSRGSVGDVSWLVLGPSTSHAPAQDTESAEQNDASLVLAMEVAGVRLLLTGDVEPPGQQAILASGADLRADVLKIPHHGSARQEPAFFAATRARVAIASAGPDNDYGHPAPRTVALARSLGMVLLRTDTQGSVAITARDGSLGVVTQRRG
ncbi:MAG: fold metallo-hydrolase [Propionibacteriaceae bacterium]|nr:fold metallo-hydrolase [Propionibacteriaceae bacterium]